MNCKICGRPLSLRMTHCSTCGTPASYATIASQQAPDSLFEPQGYVQPFPQQHSAMNGPAQAVYPLVRPEISAQVGQAQMYSVSPSRSYDSTRRPFIQKSHARNFFLLTIVVCILLLFAIGAYKLIHIANTTASGKQAHTPSGNALVPAASRILGDVQTSSAIDTTLVATQTTKTFMANQQVYVTFTITSGKQDGSIEAKWYADGQVVAITLLPHKHQNTHGVFSNVYITATPDGAVELYWCTQSNCSNAQLAQVAHFIVTPVTTSYAGILKTQRTHTRASSETHFANQMNS